MLIAETISIADFISDLYLLQQLLLTQHTAYCWFTLLQMVFSLLVTQVPLIQMLVLRNKLGSRKDSRSTYQKLLAFNTCTSLIVIQLLLLDVVFMVVSMMNVIMFFIGLLIVLLTCGKLKLDFIKPFINSIFKLLFNMNYNDVEGFRRARNISQLLFETIPQVALQIRILYWSQNHPNDKIALLKIEDQLIASITSGVLHALIQFFQIYIEAKAAKMGMLQYTVVCLNGRFNFLPYEELIMDIIMEEERVGSEKQNKLVLNFDELNTKVCGVNIDLDIIYNQLLLDQLISLLNKIKPIQDQKTIIWIEFKESLNSSSITPESFTYFMLAAKGKVLIDKSQLEYVLLNTLRYYLDDTENIFEIFEKNGMDEYCDLIYQNFYVNIMRFKQFIKRRSLRTLRDQQQIHNEDTLGNHNWIIFSIKEWVCESTDYETLKQFHFALEDGNYDSLHQLFQGEAYEAVCKLAIQQEHSQANLENQHDLNTIKEKILSSFHVITKESSLFINQFDDNGSKTLIEFFPTSYYMTKHIADFKIFRGTTIVQYLSDKYFYVIGGYQTQQRALRVSKADISEVKVLPDTLYERKSHSACWLRQDKIVLTGGHDSETKCEMYDIEQKNWNSLPDLNEGRFGHSSTSYGSTAIYVFCGFQQNSIERWEIGEEKWTTIKTKGDTLKGIVFRKCVQFNYESIIIFGGFQDKTCYKFYPRNNQIKKAEDMAAICDMYSMPEPIKDDHNARSYIIDSQLNIHLLNHNYSNYYDEKWSVIVNYIEDYAARFD